MKNLFLTLTLLVGTLTFAQDFTLFENETFTGPFTGGVVATSSVESNNSGFNSIKIVIQYKDLQPNVCNCQIFSVLEEEIAAGVWVSTANQFEAFQTQGTVATRIIELSPQFNANPGVDDFIDVPTGAIRISKTSDVAPVKFRLRIYVTEYSTNALDSLTVSAFGRKYNN
jgi:hypothetical protein